MEARSTGGILLPIEPQRMVTRVIIRRHSGMYMYCLLYSARSLIKIFNQPSNSPPLMYASQSNTRVAALCDSPRAWIPEWHSPQVRLIRVMSLIGLHLSSRITDTIVISNTISQPSLRNPPSPEGIPQHSCRREGRCRFIPRSMWVKGDPSLH